MKKYEDYFNKVEEQFQIKLQDDIRYRFKEIVENSNVVLGTRNYGKSLIKHLVKLYDFYKSNTLQNVVKLCDYFYIVKLNRPENRKTDIYCIATIGTNYIIGEIRWWGAWRKYCFFPNEDTVYDNKCMLQIMNFMNEVNLARYKDKEEINNVE